MVIYPVVYYLNNEDDSLSGRAKVDLLSQRARDALKTSAQKSGVRLDKLDKAKNGAPLPSGDIHWSVSHKPGCVAAVLNKSKIGIDIEIVQPRSEGLFGYVADKDEWDLTEGERWTFFFRVWTAKEAILKAVGVGISGLKACRLNAVPNEREMMLEYNNKVWTIEHCYYKGYIIAVTRNNNELKWVFM